MRIAVLEDDEAQTTQLQRALSSPFSREEDENACTCYDSGESLRRALRTETFDLLLLDWMVPDLEGLDLLKWLRMERLDTTPVIMLSVRGAERDVAMALNAGADDYVLKPFRPLELRARVARVYQRAARSRTELQSTFGRWAFDAVSKTVRIAGQGDEPDQTVLLTEREFRFALALFRNLNRTVSRGHLLTAAGGSSQEFPTRPLDIHIYRLRNKLALDGTRSVKLQTVYGQGYRLSGEP